MNLQKILKKTRKISLSSKKTIDELFNQYLSESFSFLTGEKLSKKTPSETKEGVKNLLNKEIEDKLNKAFRTKFFETLEKIKKPDGTSLLNSLNIADLKLEFKKKNGLDYSVILKGDKKDIMEIVKYEIGKGTPELDKDGKSVEIKPHAMWMKFIKDFISANK